MVASENILSIRVAHPDEASAISELIIAAVLKTNAKDYPAEVIEEVVANFTPDRVAALLNTRQVFVATKEGKIIGTASLDGAMIRSVFVSPDNQQHGVGTYLMQHLEKTAQMQGISCLTVPSSVTAEGFYRNLGYIAVRDEYYGQERTIIMEKHFGNT